MPDPEELARQEIDALLDRCGWTVQDKNAVNLSASCGVAVRELTFKTGEPDYTLFVDGKAIGTIEAKPTGHALTGVEEQSEKYVKRNNQETIRPESVLWKSVVVRGCHGTNAED
jgi:type I restriction enzyme R subunit